MRFSFFYFFERGNKMNTVKPKTQIDYGALTYLINRYSETYESIDTELKKILEWAPADEHPSIERIRKDVQKSAMLYLSTLEEIFDYTKKEAKK